MFETGDPISPLLFNLVGDVLTRTLMKAVDKSLIGGLLTDFRDGGIVYLQYANDTILFSDCNESHLRNLKSCLVLFEQLSGMRVNFHKSEIIPMNLDSEGIHRISQIFSFPIGTFPIKYLGVPLHFETLRREIYNPWWTKF